MKTSGNIYIYIYILLGSILGSHYLEKVPYTLNGDHTVAFKRYKEPPGKHPGDSKKCAELYCFAAPESSKPDYLQVPLQRISEPLQHLEKTLNPKRPESRSFLAAGRLRHFRLRWTAQCALTHTLLQPVARGNGKPTPNDNWDHVVVVRACNVLV